MNHKEAREFAEVRYSFGFAKLLGFNALDNVLSLYSDIETCLEENYFPGDKIGEFIGTFVSLAALELEFEILNSEEEANLIEAKKENSDKRLDTIISFGIKSAGSIIGLLFRLIRGF